MCPSGEYESAQGKKPAHNSVMWRRESKNVKRVPHVCRIASSLDNVSTIWAGGEARVGGRAAVREGE